MNEEYADAVQPISKIYKSSNYLADLLHRKGKVPLSDPASLMLESEDLELERVSPDHLARLIDIMG